MSKTLRLRKTTKLSPAATNAFRAEWIPEDLAVILYRYDVLQP